MRQSDRKRNVEGFESAEIVRREVCGHTLPVIAPQLTKGFPVDAFERARAQEGEAPRCPFGEVTEKVDLE